MKAPQGSLIYAVAQSADGYIEGPNGEFDWPIMDEELSAYSRALGEEADAFLYGRVVWDMMSGFWPRAEELSDHPHDLKFAPFWREKPKIVISRTLEKADWNTRVINENVPAEITALKEAGTTMVLFGGSVLAGYLAEHDLIDEYWMSIHPTLLGGGRPVFATGRPRARLKLVESRVFDSQVVFAHYRRDRD